MKILSTVAILVLMFISLAFAKTAQISLNATGYDWLGFTNEYKHAFANLLHIALNVDKSRYKVEDLIMALDDFYYTAIKEAKNDPLNIDEDKFLSIRCIDVIKNKLDCKTEIVKARKAPGLRLAT